MQKLLFQDQMFDTNELPRNVESHDTSNAIRCGSLEVGFAYDPPLRKMTVHVLQAQDLPDRERGGSNHVQVSTFFFKFYFIYAFD